MAIPFPSPAGPTAPAPDTPVGAAPGVVAPTAPGALGVPVSATEAQAYLAALREWVRQRRADLDAVDAALLRLTPTEQAGVTTDLTVALTFWKAVSDRLAALETTWDGGRVGPAEAERLSALIHGRLDAGGAADLPAGGSLGVSLPEACRLLDSLTRTLQARAALAPGAAEASQRITLARAGLERIRDQLPLVPAGEDRDSAVVAVARLDKRLTELVDRARRGADVGGLLGPLEIDLAVLERDLIVAAAERAETAKSRVRTERRLVELDARADAVRALEQACLAAVTPAPRLAVPNVRALGPVPQSARELAAYDARVERVARALDLVHDRYAGALAERDEVVGLAGAVAAIAAGTAVPDQAAADLAELRRRLDEVLAAVPLPVPRARALVAAYQAYVDAIGRSGGRPGRPGRKERG